MRLLTRRPYPGAVCHLALRKFTGPQWPHICMTPVFSYQLFKNVTQSCWVSKIILNKPLAVITRKQQNHNSSSHMYCTKAARWGERATHEQLHVHEGRRCVQRVCSSFTTQPALTKGMNARWSMHAHVIKLSWSYTGRLALKSSCRKCGNKVSMSPQFLCHATVPFDKYMKHALT